MPKYEMLEDCVLTLPISSNANLSDGGIALPDKMKTLPIKAEVIAVGPGLKMDDGSRFPMMLKGGEIVAYPQKSGDRIYLDGLEYIVIPERYILMIIDKPEGEEFPYNSIKDS